MINFFQFDENRYQREYGYTYAAHAAVRVDQRKLAYIVGLIAFFLPIAMLVAVATGACFYDSMSHFYYSQFWGDILVGALIFIGTFLIVYRGENAAESAIATFAGFFAYGIAVFPTTERGCEIKKFSGRALADFELSNPDGYVSIVTKIGENPKFFELFPNVEWIHNGCAALLFLFLAYYAFNVFTRSNPQQRQSATTSPSSEIVFTARKAVRNWIYKVSGSLILLSMVAIACGTLFGGGEWKEANGTFWFEALALWAFGFSWMVKGRFWPLQKWRDPEDNADQEAVRAE